MSKKPTIISSIPHIPAIGGGHGTVPAWARPDIIIAAPGGIGSHTPANAVYSAGSTTALIAGQDLQHTVQADHATVAKDGLILYTYGKATNTSKPNTETGIQLHAASGNVNTQSQSGATKLTADKSITVASTSAMVQITAPNHVLLTAAGAAIEIKGGNITLKGPGKVEFKAGMKEFKGPASASQSVALGGAGELQVDAQHRFDEQFVVKEKTSGEPLAHYKYRVETADGVVLVRGITDADGKTRRVRTPNAQEVRIVADD
jgi:type VI secretion system secreted protein VgrG